MATSYITDFVQSLNPEEIKIITEYLSIGHSKSEKGKLKRLFEILINNPEKQFTDNTLCKLLKSSNAAVRVLKSRLFEIVKEALTSNKYLENSKVFDECESVFFRLKKKLLLIKSIFRKQNERKINTENRLILEVIETAKKYQLFDILVEVITIQKQLNGVRKGLSNFQEMQNQIAFYDQCYKAVQNAGDEFLYTIINQTSQTHLTKKQRVSKLKKSIKRLEIDYKRTRAEEVNYYRHILIFALLEFEGKYNEAIDWCKKLLILVETNEISFARIRVGFALGNLSIFHIYVEKFDKAIEYARKALFYHLPNSLDYTNILELEFLANFYNRTYLKATKLISILLKHSLSDIGKFQSSLFTYYEACLLFALHEHREVLQVLNTSLEIEKDKTNRNISLRILLIMNFVELNKKEEATTALQSLRKHIERNNKNKEIKQRDILIFKLLRELEKDNFKRNEKNKKAAQLLAELSDKTKPTAWNYFTPELIPFHEWVMTLPAK